MKDDPEETVVKEELEFEKYRCFYCAINIAGEYHLSDHRIKCRGTMLMGVTPGLPRPPMPPMLFRNFAAFSPLHLPPLGFGGFG